VKTDLGAALLGALAARQRLRLGQALRRACIAAALFAVALVLAVIALVLLAWSGFYLLLPKLGPAGAALVVGLVVLGLAAVVALIGALAGRKRRRRPVVAPASAAGAGLEGMVAGLGLSAAKVAPKVALAALVAGIAVGALPLLGGRRKRD
jgi:FtsH-binding integral membrane protein